MSIKAALTLDHIAIHQLKGVGPAMAKKLEKLGLFTVQDALFHLPYRYEDRTRIYTIADALPMTQVSIIGEVQNAQIAFGRKRMLNVTIADATGVLTLRFFHFSAAQKNNLTPGTQIRCFGELKRGSRGAEMIHPEYKILKTDAPTDVEERLTPVYHTTEGVKQISLRKIIESALTMLTQNPLRELLPYSAGHYISLTDAISLVHRPPPDVSPSMLENGEHPAQQRLILEELIAHHGSMLQIRLKSDQHQSPVIAQSAMLIPAFLQNLPFSPTGAQQRVVAEIHADLATPTPMMRLVQGDVGSGKTLVAALAALAVIEQGYQVALMAPTEILAEQHALNFSQWLQPLGLQVGWLAGKTKAKARNATLQKMADGDVQMVVGTHAIFQDQVVFKNLALIIIDEQHRFGVHQRLALREKGRQAAQYPHQLIMTATPIPRTLAMTAYADLDTSVIDELPPGRTPVTTVAIPDTRRDEVIQRVRSVVEKDQRQAYWVCTLIEDSDVLQAQAAEDTTTYLQASLPGLKVGLVHGRMKANEKQELMDAFKRAELDLLVATTVIEVGVDVPNASLMIIENPERLGLAQLHQLRGRVGRGAVASHCVLLYHHPLSATASTRLAVLRDSNDGFVIAQRDLEIRGPGELLGTRQTGLADLQIADLLRDEALIPQAQNLAKQMSQQDPQGLTDIISRWIGQNRQFGNA